MLRIPSYFDIEVDIGLHKECNFDYPLVYVVEKSRR
jgi:hypothetical protein